MRSHQTRFIRAFYSLHNRRKFASWEGLLPGSSSLLAECIPVFVKVRSSIVQLRVPTCNNDSFVLHCCFGFSASTRNHVNARASSWSVTVARISAKVPIFQLLWMARQMPQTLNSRRVIRAICAASFTWIAPQDFISRLCIDLTCKSFARNASFASGVNASLERQSLSEVKMGRVSPICEREWKDWGLL